jgi:nucleoside-diphosphate-sugar epimerase
MTKLLLTGYPGWLTARFLETLPDHPHALGNIRALMLPGQTIPAEHRGLLDGAYGDILKPVTLDQATAGVDVVLHAVGVLHVKRNSDYYRVNRDGTQHILEACVRTGVKRFIYISSNAAQGFCRGKGSELSEADPCCPKSHYGISKYEGEQVVRQFQEAGKIETVILRPAMFYGPPVPPRHIDIFKRIQSGRFPVFGDGENLRSLTYIDHLIQAIHLVLKNPKANGQTYYIADQEIPTLNQIIQAMADALRVSVRIIRLPRWLARVAEFVDLTIAKADFYWMLPHLIGESDKNIACQIDKARRELGYTPSVDYREGYRRTIAWCREHRLL